MAENQYTRSNKKNGLPSQAILDAGLNVFGLQLLVESFTELAGKDTLPLSFTYLGVNVTLQIAGDTEQTVVADELPCGHSSGAVHNYGSVNCAVCGSPVRR